MKRAYIGRNIGRSMCDAEMDWHEPAFCTFSAKNDKERVFYFCCIFAVFSSAIKFSTNSFNRNDVVVIGVSYECLFSQNSSTINEILTIMIRVFDDFDAWEFQNSIWICYQFVHTTKCSKF